jgi:FkbM family methyltransferase
MLKEVFLSRDYYFDDAPQDPTILDGGGNIGISAMFFKEKYPSSKITVFEPDPETRQILKENISKLTNINIEPYALSNEESVVDFYSNEINPGGSSLYAKSQQNKTPKKISVRCKKLSDYIDKEIYILKLDVEGAELSVLKDIEETDKIKKIKNIVMEYHHNNDNKLSEIIKILEKANMKISFGKSIFDKRQFYDSYFIIRASQI